MRSGRAVTCLALAAYVASAVATGAAACDDGGNRPAAAPSRTGSPSAGGCAVPGVGPADGASVLRPGPTNGLPASTARGEPLTIDGVVLAADCRPAPGASLDVWHTDARGDYQPDGTETCCYYKGTVRTDRNGRFRLETIRPAQYREPNAPPAHIHFEIRHASATLTTQIVFTNGPDARVAWPTSNSLAVPLSRAAGADGWQGRAAFVLPR